MMGPTNNQLRDPDDVRRMLRVLPQRRPSADLAMRLRVLASQESAPPEIPSVASAELAHLDLRFQPVRR